MIASPHRAFPARLCIVSTFAIAFPATLLPSQTAASWAPVQQALGQTGALQPGDVMRFSFPRRDLRVVVGDVQVNPSLLLASWVGFKRMGDGQAMLMGDLVLTEGEINTVISVLQRGGVEQTALHNHVVGGIPLTMNLHIHGQGSEVDLARVIRGALEATKTPLEAASTAPSPPFDLDSAAIAKTLGYAGRVSGGVMQFNVARAERIMHDGHEVPPAMGLTTVIRFQPTGAGRAAIAGDFIMLGSEVNAVIRALRENGIGVAALHSHMIDETPRLYFMHFWANDDAIKLARGLSAALGKTNSVKPAAKAQ